MNSLSSVKDSPLRIGLLGLGRLGAFHSEQIGLRRDLFIAATCPLLETPDHQAKSGTVNRDARLLDFLARRDLDFVLVAAPQQSELAKLALEAGQNVALLPPVGESYTEARSLVEMARSCRRKLVVLPSRRGGLNFRVAHNVVRSDRLGHLTSARLISWAKAIPGNTADNDSPVVDSKQTEGTFTFFACQYVDQLLQLFTEVPRTVFAKIRRMPPTESSSAAFLISIVFENGGDALIDVNLQSGATLQTGWMLAGHQGSFCQDRIYTTEPSGEVCDVPVNTTDLPEFDIYKELLAAGDSAETLSPSARDALDVMRVIDAARESSRTGHAVQLNVDRI